jgi:hypothetical protein
LNEYETQFLVKGGFKFKTAFKMHYQTGRKRKTKKTLMLIIIILFGMCRIAKLIRGFLIPCEQQVLIELAINSGDFW